MSTQQILFLVVVAQGDKEFICSGFIASAETFSHLAAPCVERWATSTRLHIEKQSKSWSESLARTLKLLIQNEHSINTALEITSVAFIKQAATEQLTSKTGVAVRNLDQPALR